MCALDHWYLVNDKLSTGDTRGSTMLTILSVVEGRVCPHSGYIMKKRQKKIGFIGCGNMGQAILAGIVADKIVPARSIIVCDNDKQKLNRLKRKHGITTAASNDAVIDHADIIILAVKPQALSELGISCAQRKNKVIVSILAGTTTAKLKKILKTKQVVRTMPNLGAMLGISITAIATTNAVSKKTFKEISTLLSACGDIVTVPERSMNAVTAISGSGPAYYFYLSELLVQAAIKNGLTKDVAEKLVVKTACAASAMMRISDKEPALLRQMVTSKKGTTEAALKKFKKMKLDKAVAGGVKAAIQRGEELSK